MSKYEQAQYLVNIHTLMFAQTVTSPWLADEYTRVWEEFKKEVVEKKDARTSGQDERFSDQERTYQPRDQSGFRSTDRRDPSEPRKS